MKIETTPPQKNYELLDSGEGEKLERYGEYVLRRPDPQALWKKRLPDYKWHEADASFSRSEKAGKWVKNENVPDSWNIELAGLTLKIIPSPFKHTGIFPEQFPNWLWSEALIKSARREISVLNLFGYSGAATVACTKAGAKVTHVDASKSAISMAKENAILSDLPADAIRWILDDAFAFVKKEVKRGKKYDAIIMDPPAFGRGPAGEVWKIEESFLELLENSKKLLSDKPLFFLLNGYASGYSAIAYKNNISDLKDQFGGTLEEGELAIEESGSGRLLPAGIFARWAK